MNHIVILFLAAMLLALSPALAQEPKHAITMYDTPKYAPGFTHFDYVNPAAPKGGTLRLWAPETFDNVNGFNIKGVAAAGTGLLYASLMEKSQDEPFTMYAALAETIEVPEDRSWVIFTIRPQATFSDGHPVTAEDVVWTFNTLVEQGRPAYRAYYANVEKVEALDERRVKFTFDQAGNRELPMIVGELSILPKHYWADKDFSASTLETPVGSGPYKLTQINAGRSLEYSRIDDWWGNDLPVYKGRYNFGKITYTYFKDQNISLEGLFSNEYDFRQEFTAKLWATAYDAPPVLDGRIKKELIKNQVPQGMQGFVFNLRRPIFQDKAVRKAVNYAFDFEWSNKQFAYDAYIRTRSYFQNSEMEAKGLPGGKELEILEAFRGQVPEEVFITEFNPPSTDGTGRNRSNLRTAISLLEGAGYKTGPDGIRLDPETGNPLSFEFLVSNTNAGFERWFQPFKQNLERIGIKADIRIVDASQYLNRILEFDYDFIVQTWGQSTSPGNEQREFWGSKKADVPGSRNYIGLKDPVVDALIEKIVSAPTRADLVAASRALDRVLQHGWYVVPNWHIAAWRVAYWDKFEQPDTQAPYSLGVIDTWWVK